MESTALRIREIVASAKSELLKITPESAGQKINVTTWSKKEILGHLIDSASNNHQRFVRAAQNDALDFPAYNQNEWVTVQCYNEMNWFELINLFALYNVHLSRIIEYFSPDALNNLCNIGKEKPVTLEYVIDDYVAHLEHHIEKILE